jgi:ABC-2 type transport system permease protein
MAAGAISNRTVPRVARTLLEYRDMVRQLAITDFKLKYQGSVLGYLWSLAKPMAVFTILYIVFTRFIKIGGAIPHYALYLLLGIVLWSYFADSTGTAMVSIVDRGELIRKVYFPRIVIPIAASLTSLFTLFFNLIVIAIFIAFSGVPLSTSALLFVVLLVELYVLSLGCSLLLAALYVRFRDFRHIWELGLQVMFYATPIIYPLSLVPHSIGRLLALNPIAQIVEDGRKAVLLSHGVSSVDLLGWPLGIVPYVVPPLLLLVGFRYFEAAAARFAEEL